MKILKVIHGYPYRYNAGSEVYSQTLCQELVRQGHEVIVFTRQENAYKQEYSIEWETDPTCSAIKLCLINMTHSKEGYRHVSVDRAFADLLEDYKPDVVHVGHLNHLSTSLVTEAHHREVPLVFTLHDFWLMCPRGQFLQCINSKTEDLYPACDSQANEKCARQCYWRYFSKQEDEEDIQYWTKWVDKRMNHVREISSLIDLYIAPSHYLRDRFINDFPLDPTRIIYLDYGFHLERFQGRIRQFKSSNLPSKTNFKVPSSIEIPEKSDFIFGYIGTHQQGKGIFHLLQAFRCLPKNSQLKIWGSSLQPFTQSLKSYVKNLGVEIEARIHWMEGYRNDYIVHDVFNHVDAIVVPSIWGENSPLVIHEALEAKVPVITADYGGMKEYVQHGVNGLLFTHRNPADLAVQMKRLVNEPLLAHQIVKEGYLQSNDRHIPSIQEHVEQIVAWYNFAIEGRKKADDPKNRSLAYHI